MTGYVQWAARLVAVAAAIATVHGMHAAVAATALGWLVAWLYPAMTDALGVVAYAATRQLPTSLGRGYAWAVVLLAVGMSGLAQAVWLGAGGVDVPPWLARVIGGWPALAVLLVGHLVWLLDRPTPEPERAAGAVPGGALARTTAVVGQRVSLIKAPRSAPVPAVPEYVPPTSTATDDVLVADLRRVLDGRDGSPSIADVRARYGIGTPRATRVRAAAEQYVPATNGSPRS